MEESNKAQEKEKKVALRDALLEQIQTNQAVSLSLLNSCALCKYQHQHLQYKNVL